MRRRGAASGDACRTGGGGATQQRAPCRRDAAHPRALRLLRHLRGARGAESEARTRGKSLSPFARRGAPRQPPAAGCCPAWSCRLPRRQIRAPAHGARQRSGPPRRRTKTDGWRHRGSVGEEAGIEEAQRGGVRLETSTRCTEVVARRARASQELVEEREEQVRVGRQRQIDVPKVAWTEAVFEAAGDTGVPVVGRTHACVVQPVGQRSVHHVALSRRGHFAH